MKSQAETNICKVCRLQITEKSPVNDLCFGCFEQEVKLFRLIDYMQTTDIKNINIIQSYQQKIAAALERDFQRKQPLTEKRRAYLLQLSTNKAFELVSEETVFGRNSEKADYVIGNNAMSSVHATLKNENGKYFLFDNGSSNGTWLNGERIAPRKIYSVSANDTICFANEKMIFIIK